MSRYSTNTESFWSGRSTRKDFGNRWITKDFVQAEELEIGGDLYVNRGDHDVQRVSLQPIFTTRPGPVNFTGRELYLKELSAMLHRYLQCPAKESKTRGVVMQGMPGVGKTSLAAELIQRNKTLLSSCHVLWIQADTRATIFDSFVEICERHFVSLNEEIRDSDGTLIGQEQVMRRIYDRLCVCPSVIVFDNAACEESQFGMNESINAFLCKSSPSNKHLPMYVVTTRVSSPLVWESPPWTIINLDAFIPEESWNYMSSSIPFVRDHKESMIKLSEFYGHLPVAVEQAINVIMYECEIVGGAASSAAIDSIIKNVQNVMFGIAHSDGNYEKLNRLWDYSLKQLEDATSGDCAHHILCILSLLSPDGVPVDFLRKIMANLNEDGEYSLRMDLDPNSLEKYLHLLRLFSVVSKPDQDLYVHVLLQQHVQRQLQREGSWEQYVKLIATATTKCSNLSSYGQDNYGTNFQNLKWICKSLMMLKGDDTFDLKKQFAEKLISNHYAPSVLIELLNTLLPARLQSKDYKGVEEYCQNNPNLDPQVACLLSKCYLQEGKIDLAEDLLLGVLHEVNAERRQTWRSELPKVLYLLAITKKRKGDYGGAVSSSTDALRHINKDDPGSLQLFLNICSVKADLLQILGKGKEALAVLNEIYEVEDRLGIPSFETADQIAMVHFGLGNMDEARSNLENAHSIACRALGPEDPISLNIKGDLGHFEVAAGNLVKGLKLLKQVFESSLSEFGRYHHLTLMFQSNLARCYAEVGNLVRAFEEGTNALYNTERIRGKRHPKTLIAKAALASYHVKNKDPAKALELANDVYEGYCSVFGPNHPESLSCKGNLAVLYAETGNVKKGLKLHEEMRLPQQRILGSKHYEVLNAEAQLAYIHFLGRDLDKAIHLSEQVFKERCDVLGPSHLDTVSSHRDTAAYYYSAKNYTHAMEILKEIIQTENELLGPQHPNTLLSKTILAECHYENRDLTKALQIREEVDRGNMMAYGDCSLFTIQSKMRLAIVLSDLGDVGESIRRCEEVAQSLCQEFGAQHSYTISFKIRLASMYLVVGRLEESKSLHIQVYDGYLALKGEEYKDTILAKAKLADCYGEAQNYAEALKHFRELDELTSRIQDRGLKAELHVNDHIERLKRLKHLKSISANSDEFLKLHDEVHDLTCKIYGKNHVKSLLNKRILANRYATAMKLNRAMELTKETYLDFSLVLGPEHPDTLMVKGDLAQRYLEQNDEKTALQISLDVYERMCKLWKPEHPYALQAASSLAIAYFYNGHFPESLKYCTATQNKIRALANPTDQMSAQAVARRLDNFRRYFERTLVLIINITNRNL